ncbi:MAG: dihydrofolate reductase [Hyphomicrobiaceae bacterium]
MSGKPTAVCFIVAVGENGVIGNAGALPWRLSTDLKLFRRLTLGKPVIMGRKTYESIGRPLDGRDNIVVTRDPAFGGVGLIVVQSVDAALERARELAAARNADEIAVIGGAEIFQALLPQADRIYLTRVHASPPGDTFFPTIDASAWHETSRERLLHGLKDQYEATLIVLDRVGLR